MAVDAATAEGALVRADHRLRRPGRKIDVATFAVGAQLEHTPGLPDDDCRHIPAAPVIIRRFRASHTVGRCRQVLLTSASRCEDCICCCCCCRDASPHGRTALTFVEVPHPAIIGKRWCTDRFTAQLRPYPSPPLDLVKSQQSVAAGPRTTAASNRAISAPCATGSTASCSGCDRRDVIPTVLVR